MMSTPPNNQMNAVSSTLGADLPLNSRYMGTVSYSGMRQNDAFLPFASTGIPGLTMANGLPAASLSTIPALVRTQGGVGVTSLNGSINTLLVNNVVTTQITPDLKTKLSYRYYDYSNQTPELHITDWIIADAASPLLSGHQLYVPVNSLSLGYIKQNAGAEATWRPVNSVNIGAPMVMSTTTGPAPTPGPRLKTPARFTPTGNPPHGSRRVQVPSSRSGARVTMTTPAMSAFSSGRFSRSPTARITRHTTGNSTSMTATAPRPSSPSTSRCSTI